MEQNGADNQGILGFLEADIRKCVQRSASTKCFYCHQKSASIMCKHKTCKRSFHLICGARNDCLFQFSETFNSYCHQHHGIKDGNINGHDECMICWEPMGDYNPIKSIPTCCKMGWIHAYCMRKTATFAGYLLHCPTCGSKESSQDFCAALRKRGIFVPEKDASWELSQNAFQSLLFVYASCDAKQCFCPNGRNFNIKRRRSKWFLMKCIYCGSKGIHFGCSPHDLRKFKCPECTLARSQSLLSAEAQSLQSECVAGEKAAKPTEIVDLTIDDNSYEAEEQSPSIQSNIQIMEITSSNESYTPVVEGDMDALVSVPECSNNIFKIRSIVLKRDRPPPDTEFIENLDKLSNDRLKLLLFRWISCSVCVDWTIFLYSKCPRLLNFLEMSNVIIIFSVT